MRRLERTMPQLCRGIRAGLGGSGSVRSGGSRRRVLRHERDDVQQACMPSEGILQRHVPQQSAPRTPRLSLHHDLPRGLISAGRGWVGAWGDAEYIEWREKGVDELRTEKDKSEPKTATEPKTEAVPKTEAETEPKSEKPKLEAKRQ